ncbi:M23 family metallopeptidase [Phenylobacterium sp.]|uniref:M23 family metallopeptidase n=1 Tax=Phenylobacterium sp. TaxID=1871053 RepID=UPI002C52E41C|nr:M23 family metallopeptidase [Phenylobacterium sp.]HLZ74982.1 M23 family metallopeptidase [Phenylobacterium sp.]
MRLAPSAAGLALATGIALGGLGVAQAQPPAPKLAFPVACEIGRSCEIQHYVDRDPGPGLLDYRCGRRTEPEHDGVDIRILDMAAQRAGVDVLAAAPGRVIAVRDGVPDVSIRAPGAPSVAGHMAGNRVGIALGGGWILDYAHLANGSLKVKLGDMVAVGQPLARVGLSGSTDFPHLHFSVRHDNQVVDPFAPGALSGCATEASSLWTPAAADAMPYKRGAVLNTGFSSAMVAGPAIEARSAPPPSTDAAALVAYARLIGLEAGDVVQVRIFGPDGKVLGSGTLAPLATNRDDVPVALGHKRPPQGWVRGVYAAVVEVRRAGAIALSQRWQTTL